MVNNDSQNGPRTGLKWPQNESKQSKMVEDGQKWSIRALPNQNGAKWLEITTGWVPVPSLLPSHRSGLESCQVPQHCLSVICRSYCSQSNQPGFWILVCFSLKNSMICFPLPLRLEMQFCCETHRRGNEVEIFAHIFMFAAGVHLFSLPPNKTVDQMTTKSNQEETQDVWCQLTIFKPGWCFT